MAIGWLALVKAVPWGEVIAAAPAVVGAAKKLLGNARRETAEVGTDMARAAEGGPAERLAAVESQIIDMQEQLLASSKLIEQLAEQNEQLVARLEMHRRRLRWLTAAAVVLGVGLAWLLVLVGGIGSGG